MTEVICAMDEELVMVEVTAVMEEELMKPAAVEGLVVVEMMTAVRR